MIIYPQTIEMKYSPTMKKIFLKNGIIECKKDSILQLDILNLEDNCKKEIKCKCDNCGQIFYKKYKDIKDFGNIDQNILSIKTFCKNKECINIAKKHTYINKYGVDNPMKSNEIKNKVMNTNLSKYGTTSPMKSDIVKEKKKNTCLDRYGTNSPLSNKEIQQKIKDTNLIKYGVANVFESEEIKNKIKNTNLIKYGHENPYQSLKVKESIKNKYGVDNVFQVKEVKDKIKTTMIKNYGVDHPMKNENIKNKAITNSFNSLINNGGFACSKQQKYIHEIIGGELNYPIHETKFLLDIAFIKEKIYIEYDGSGHDLTVRMGKQSLQQLHKKDKFREIYMKEKGWKIIRIISSKDKLPSKIDLEILIKKYIEILKNDKIFYVYINIDKMKVYTENKIENIFLNVQKI